MRVVPLEPQHGGVDGIPLKLGRFGLDLVFDEIDHRSFAVGDEVALAGLEIDMGVVVVGGEGDILAAADVVNSQVGGVGQQLMVLELEESRGDVGAVELHDAGAEHAAGGDL